MNNYKNAENVLWDIKAECVLLSYMHLRYYYSQVRLLLVECFYSNARLYMCVCMSQCVSCKRIRKRGIFVTKSRNIRGIIIERKLT